MTDDAIDASSEDAIDTPTEDAIDESTDMAIAKDGNENHNTINNAKSDFKKVMAVDTQIQGLNIEGNNFNIEKIQNEYILTVTGCPITISGSTTGAVDLFIDVMGNSTITLDNLNVKDMRIFFWGNGDPVNINVDGNNQIGALICTDDSSYDHKFSDNVFDDSSVYRLKGINGASLTGSKTINKGNGYMQCVWDPQKLYLIMQQGG